MVPHALCSSFNIIRAIKIQKINTLWNHYSKTVSDSALRFDLYCFCNKSIQFRTIPCSWLSLVSAYKFLRIHLALMTLTTLKITGQFFVKLLLSLYCPDVSSWFCAGPVAFDRIVTEMVPHSHRIWFCASRFLFVPLLMMLAVLRHHQPSFVYIVCGLLITLNLFTFLTVDIAFAIYSVSCDLVSFF